MTDADSRTDRSFESLRNLSRKNEKRRKNGAVDASTRPRNGSTRGQWTLCTHPPFLGLHACNKMDGPVLLHARACLITGRRKNRMGRGHQTNTIKRTSRLYDRIGPVGRFAFPLFGLVSPSYGQGSPVVTQRQMIKIVGLSWW